jgi:hypothetical protein
MHSRKVAAEPYDLVVTNTQLDTPSGGIYMPRVILLKLKENALDRSGGAQGIQASRARR